MQEFRKVIVITRASKVPSALYKEALSLTDAQADRPGGAACNTSWTTSSNRKEAPFAKERLAALK